MAPFYTEVDGVVFCESTLEGSSLGEIREYGAAQNTTLVDVKKVMARKVLQMGGNAVINFKYVQKADKGLHLLKWDKERLNCSGTVVRLERHPSEPENAPHQADSQICPQCAEVIKKAALKCRFCGSDISRA